MAIQQMVSDPTHCYILSDEELMTIQFGKHSFTFKYWLTNLTTYVQRDYVDVTTLHSTESYHEFIEGFRKSEIQMTLEIDGEVTMGDGDIITPKLIREATVYDAIRIMTKKVKDRW